MRARAIPLLLAGLLVAGACLLPQDSPARGSSCAPRNGFEDPTTSHRMKSNPGSGAMIDAYGYPVENVVPEPEPRKRLPPGAYGGYDRKRDERPLPDEKDTRPLW